MKKLLLCLWLLFTLTPCFASMEVCGDEDVCINYREDLVKQVYTTSTPNYGVIIELKNGHKQFIQASTRAHAVLMLNEAYQSLQEYYNWSDDTFYNMLEKQDKAHLRIQ